MRRFILFYGREGRKVEEDMSWNLMIKNFLKMGDIGFFMVMMVKVNFIEIFRCGCGEGFGGWGMWGCMVVYEVR